MGTIIIIYESNDELSTMKMEIKGARKTEIATAYISLEILQQQLLETTKNDIEFKKEGNFI